MDTPLVSQLLEHFKSTYGLKIDSAEQLFDSQRNLLEYLVRLGRGLENQMFEALGKGYEGATIEKGGRRAYYVGCQGQAESWIPLDERLGIAKRHTPGFHYFLSSFTGREAYQESLDRFHEIFRPDGRHLVSMRKALDLDYELGAGLQQQRQQEIQQVFQGRQALEVQRALQGSEAVSIDATKVREKLREYVDDGGKKRCEIGFRDAKIGVISEARWDAARSEAYCTDSSYVAGIEHAEEFFQRVWVEMNRRIADPRKPRIVFLADGANWIWDRVADLTNEFSVLILDFYHACEHLSALCKQLYGEQTEPYWQHFNGWREAFLQGKVLEVIGELKQLRAGCRGQSAKSCRTRSAISRITKTECTMTATARCSSPSVAAPWRAAART
jgi:hypothetical protein